MEEKQMLGKVKWFDKKRGYGFIINEDSFEYFFHWSAIISEDDYKTIEDDQRVSFEMDDTEKTRLKAKNVRKI